MIAMSKAEWIRSEVELLEKFKEYAVKAGCIEVEVCSGCGKEGCTGCPCGTSYKVRNIEADRLRRVLASIGVDHPEKHPAYKDTK